MTIRRWLEVVIVTFGAGALVYYALSASPLWAIIGLVVASFVLCITIGSALVLGSRADDANERLAEKLRSEE